MRPAPNTSRTTHNTTRTPHPWRKRLDGSSAGHQYNSGVHCDVVTDALNFLVFHGQEPPHSYLGCLLGDLRSPPAHHFSFVYRSFCFLRQGGARAGFEYSGKVRQWKSLYGIGSPLFCTCVGAMNGCLSCPVLVVSKRSRNRSSFSPAGPILSLRYTHAKERVLHGNAAVEVRGVRCRRKNAPQYREELGTAPPDIGIDIRG